MALKRKKWSLFEFKQKKLQKFGFMRDIDKVLEKSHQIEQNGME